MLPTLRTLRTSLRAPLKLSRDGVCRSRRVDEVGVSLLDVLAVEAMVEIEQILTVSAEKEGGAVESCGPATDGGEGIVPKVKGPDMDGRSVFDVRPLRNRDRPFARFPGVGVWQSTSRALQLSSCKRRSSSMPSILVTSIPSISQ